MSYKLTVRACYIGIVCSAIMVNLLALLFTVLGEQFGLSFAQLGSMVMVIFIVQVAVAFIFGPIVDRIGFRPFIVGAHVLAVAGMGWFAATPLIPFDPYIMMMIGAFIFGVSGGFLELLLSPILNAIPTDEKSSAMSILHAFYCFGHVAVVFGTTIFIEVFGREAWPFIFLLWLLVPLANSLLYAKCPIAEATPVDKQSTARDAFRSPLLYVLVAMIAFGAASEMIFATWTSAFMEEAMGLTKIIGDIIGVGAFAVSMGIGRLGYGILKQKNVPWLPEQSRLMLMGSALALVSYLIIATTNSPILGLLACIMCGFGVSLLWPGALSLAVDAFPKAGTWIFAILTIGGTFGASAGPSVFGVIADIDGLRTAFMVMAIAPLCSLMVGLLYKKLKS